MKTVISSLVSAHKVVVFSKTTCGYCARVKTLFKDIGVQPHVVELDQVKDGVDLQKGLHEMTGQRTVPNVFVKGKSIGGCDSTTKLHHEGKLLPLINN